MEPGWHVSHEKWERSLRYAKEAGFDINSRVKVQGRRVCELINSGA